MYSSTQSGRSRSVGCLGCALFIGGVNIACLQCVSCLNEKVVLGLSVRHSWQCAQVFLGCSGIAVSFM